jgi:hypothetical protein
MTHRITGVLAVSIAVAAILAGSAAAIPTAEDESWATDYSPSQTWPETEYVPEYETIESDPGFTCGLGGEPIASALATTGPATTLASGSYEDQSEGDACAAGTYRPSCKQVKVAVRQRTALGLSLAFEWVVEKSWCWDYPRVTWWSVREYPTQMDRFMIYRGVVGRWDEYFTWCCFSTRSGHRTYRMARFENCVPFRGCLGSWYPRVRVQVHGNGTYSVTQKEV